MQSRKLEQYKYFQPIAWVLCLTFAGFVGMLTLQLQSTIENLESHNTLTDERIKSLESTVYTDQNQ